MERIEKSIDVRCPVRIAYNQWTQFEEFPRFMTGVKEVKQLDATHVHWRADFWGKEKEWDAEIVEQVPDDLISWRSVAGDAPNAGTVRFETLGVASTRVYLALEYETKGIAENVGEALGMLDARLDSTLSDFKRYIESRGIEDGGWRGEIHGARAQSPRIHHSSTR